MLVRVNFLNLPRAGDIAEYRLACALVTYSFGDLVLWDLLQGLERGPSTPMVGLMVLGSRMTLLILNALGLLVFARFSGDAWFDWEWGHLDLLPQEVGDVVDKCRLFCSVPGPLQSVSRAEMWCVTLALQAAAVVLKSFGGPLVLAWRATNFGVGCSSTFGIDIWKSFLGFSSWCFTVAAGSGTDLLLHFSTSGPLRLLFLGR